MSDLTSAQEWKTKTNEEYQKVVAVIMNLATAVLFLPILFLKDFVKSPNGKSLWPLLPYIYPWALFSWILLALSLVCGMSFYWSSAKFVKAVYQDVDPRKESQIECWRDWSVKLMVLFFIVGFAFLIVFFVKYSPPS